MPFGSPIRDPLAVPDDLARRADLAPLARTSELAPALGYDAWYWPCVDGEAYPPTLVTTGNYVAYAYEGRPAIKHNVRNDSVLEARWPFMPPIGPRGEGTCVLQFSVKAPYTSGRAWNLPGSNNHGVGIMVGEKISSSGIVYPKGLGVFSDGSRFHLYGAGGKLQTLGWHTDSAWHDFVIEWNDAAAVVIMDGMEYPAVPTGSALVGPRDDAMDSFRWHTYSFTSRAINSYGTVIHYSGLGLTYK